jgi:hypothetical protein
MLRNLVIEAKNARATAQVRSAKDLRIMTIVLPKLSKHTNSHRIVLTGLLLANSIDEHASKYYSFPTSVGLNGSSLNILPAWARGRRRADAPEFIRSRSLAFYIPPARLPRRVIHLAIHTIQPNRTPRPLGFATYHVSKELDSRCLVP